MASAGDALLQLINRAIQKHTWTVLPTEVKIVISRSTDEAGTLGAALAAMKHLESMHVGGSSIAVEDSEIINSVKNKLQSCKTNPPFIHNLFNEVFKLPFSGIFTAIGYISTVLFITKFALGSNGSHCKFWNPIYSQVYYGAVGNLFCQLVPCALRSFKFK
jgi:hypothetical protein